MQFTDYLIEQAGVTPEKIDDLRSTAQSNGRSLFDQAYLSGMLDERNLLSAIRLSSNFPTVELQKRKIDLSILQLLSGKQAWRLKILPFAIDQSKKIISLACKKQEDEQFLKEIEEIFPDYIIKLFTAVGPVLETSIIELYRSEPLLETKPERQLSEIENSNANYSHSKVAYIIGAITKANSCLGQALVEDDYQVFLADSWSDLQEEIKNHPPDLVLINESNINNTGSGFTGTVPPEIPDSVIIKRYKSISELLDPTLDIIEHGSLAVTNLHLATEALAHALDGDKLKLPAQIGMMVERVCQQLHLAPHDHLITVTAGYLQDITALHFKGEEPSDRQAAYFMLQGLIEDSRVYPPSVLGVIRSMYCDLSVMKPNDVTMAETRNGNILTAVDYYFRQFPKQKQITPITFDLIDHKIRDQIGRLFLPEVAEGLLSLLSSEVTLQMGGQSTNQALVFDELGVIDAGLSKVITESNFGFNLTSSIEQFSNKFQLRMPELIIITSGSCVKEIETLIQKMISRGIVLDAVPTFMIHKSNEFQELAKLTKYGIGHSIHLDGAFEILNYHLKKIAHNKEQESRKRLQVLQDMGTHGSLTDMNLIDLLQSMGLSNKTMCINVSGKGHHLTMFLHQGQLVHAATTELDGVEAVYEAIKWDSGIWSVDHITHTDIPEPNITQSIDSVLMQGCYLLDEMNRAQSNSSAPVDTL